LTPRKNKPEPVVVDARGLKCPWPVLRAARAMREHPDIALLSDDPVALTDVPILAQTHGWTAKVTDRGDHSLFMISKPTH
jgi:tRNA 2-thiouridine synthesizing protein A